MYAIIDGATLWSYFIWSYLIRKVHEAEPLICLKPDG
jgi:hypothetical protein